MMRLKKVEEKTGNPAMEVFDQAINNIMPVLELKVRRIGGLTTKYQLKFLQKEE